MQNAERRMPAMDCDLHIHTVNSDGSMSVKDVIYYAQKSGLKNIAITDHDTMRGVEEALYLEKSMGIQVIPAVETTVMDTKRNRPVHVLCYFPKNIAILEKFLQRTLDHRRKQKLEMIEKIQKLYPLLELDHIFRYAKYSQSIYESHIMQSLCDLGYTNTAIGTLMEDLISKKGSCYVPSNYPSIEELLEVLEKVKAVVVIAHPEEFDSFELAKELAVSGKIDGLEYDHPRNGVHSRVIIKQIADEYNLILTGGSDFHGQYARQTNLIGSYGCEETVITQMERIKAKKGI
jgi:predicted metal-dependent phosphoesterase TrpH